MYKPDLAFIVVGMPRSGTSWIANWLTTDRVLCLHDPFAQGMPEHWPSDKRKLGISCTLAYQLEGWLDKFSCPKVMITRDEEERDASLTKMGLTPMGSDDRFYSLGIDSFPYEWLWDEDCARDLWKHLLPDEPFDSLRYRQLVRMQVQPHPKHWTIDMSVIERLTLLGYLKR